MCGVRRRQTLADNWLGASGAKSAAPSHLASGQRSETERCMTPNDRAIIRDLAKQIAEIAARPEQDEKRKIWYAQSSFKPIRPPVYCSPEGSWVELLPDTALVCGDEDARQIEHGLRRRIYAAEHFHDDQVCEATYSIFHAVEMSGWGVHQVYTHPEAERGAYIWDAPIKTRDDLTKLRKPTAAHNPDQTRRGREYAEELVGDILKVEQKSPFWLSAGLIDQWTYLRGINQTFIDMNDDPEMVHAGMKFLMEGTLACMEEFESQVLLTLNNGNDYCGSGSFGWTRELPSPGFNGQVRLVDLWGFADAQTMSLVSPAMHEEFVLRYQLPILERFGLNYYGCCEPLHLKLDMLKRHVPRLRRVSISPWADKRMSAEKLGPNIIFGWKPNPAYLAAVEFDADLVRRDIRETIDICKEYGCPLEMTIKDTHTCNHEPGRFEEWTRIAMEESMRAAE
jgi:hypothetical protein